jgi:hypothetical protein
VGLNGSTDVKGEIVSLELAVGAAAFVLGTRLFSLIQATRGVPDAHNQILEAVAGGDSSTLQTRTRGVGYKNPYGEVAAELIRAHQRGGDGKKRADHIKRAAFLAEKRLIRRTQQGQALDLAALAIACGIVVFSRKTLPAGPLFWSLGGAVVVLLLSSLAARAQLKASVLSSLNALRSTLVARPQLPSLSEENIPCFWCGEKTARGSFEVIAKANEKSSFVEATYCNSCGKFVTTLTPTFAEDGDSQVGDGSPPSSETEN